MVQSQLATMELTECLTDSPYFRETLHSYEKELESTNSSIKSLIKIIKDLLSAARRLSECQRAFSSALDAFHFATIGGTQTDDEAVICSSLKEFSRLVNTIESERSRMLDNECSQFVLALENFRATHIASAKEGRKKFEKQTQKFCTSMERHLNMSTKKHEDHAMKEADASLEMEQRCFVQTSMNYVCKLQEIEQRKKFDFVETLLTFVYGWLTFYHHGYEVAQDSKPFMNDLQSRLQKTREEFDETRTKVESLKNKTLEERQTKSPMYSRQGYLYLMEKKAFGTTWAKHYCMYEKKEKFLSLVPYNQLNGKQSDPVVLRLRTCVRRMSETIDRRFCFDVTAQERDGQVYTLQATCAEDRRLWMDAMDGKEPTYCKPGLDHPTEHTALDDAGFYFVNKCVAQLEGRGLEEQGLYRVVGVASKVTRLVQLGHVKAKFDKQCLDSPVEWESKTITSAIKTYFRNLPEPLMTYRLHSDFILAAKNDNKDVRVAEVHRLVNQLPKVNYRMLKTLLQHLTNVSAKSDRNLMSVSNLGVCFGPTLLRPEEETMAAIIDIKFCNIVVEILIRYFYKMFGGGGFAAGGDLSPLVADSADSGAAVVAAPLPLMNGCGGAPTIGGATSTGGVAPDKSAIISATAQPIQIMSYDSEPPLAKPLRPGSVGSTSLAAAAAAQRRPYPPLSAPITSSGHLPPPYAHPPPPPHTLQHSSPPSSADSSLTQLPHRIQHPLHVFNPAVMNDRDRVEGCLVGGSGGGSGGGSANISNNSMSGSGLSGSSSESLSSPRSSPRGDPPPPKGPSVSGISTGSGSVAGQPPSPYSTRGKLGIHYPPSYRSQPDLRVRTLYACVGENTSELSFEPNQIITNVRPSREPGWLEGTLNGHFGLVPDNYVEYLP